MPNSPSKKLSRRQFSVGTLSASATALLVAYAPMHAQQTTAPVGSKSQAPPKLSSDSPSWYIDGVIDSLIIGTIMV
jgi:hypothetical protein